MLTASGTDENLLEAIRAGAAGYLLKSESPETHRPLPARGDRRRGSALGLDRPPPARPRARRRPHRRRCPGCDRQAALRTRGRGAAAARRASRHRRDRDTGSTSPSTRCARTSRACCASSASPPPRGAERLAVARGAPRPQELTGNANGPICRRRGLDERRAASRGCSRPRARRRHAARAASPGLASSRKPSTVTSMSDRGSSTCASKPAETISRSGSKPEIRGSTILRERRRILGVPGAARERDVEDVPARRVRATGPRVERPLVQGDEEDRVVVAHDRLGAVAVVNVPVDDRHSLDSELRLRVAGRDDDVVEDAEPHRAVRAARGAPVDERARSRSGRRPRSRCPRRGRPPPRTSRTRSCRGRGAAACRSHGAASRTRPSARGEADPRSPTARPSHREAR